MGRERGSSKLSWIAAVVALLLVGVAIPSQLVFLHSSARKVQTEIRGIHSEVNDLRHQLNQEIRDRKAASLQTKANKPDDKGTQKEAQEMEATPEPVAAKEEKKDDSLIEIDASIRQVQDPVIKDIDCPALAPAVHMEIPLEHLPRKKRTTVAQKYDRRAVNCLKHGLWSSVSKVDHYKIMKGIANLIDLKQNDVVFDWGSGCGHKLHWFSKEYNTSGLGVDLSFKTLLYAWENTTQANKFCYGDGSLLDWIPSNTFDAVFSFGAIFHVYNETLMCRSYREMVRIAKKGAKIFNGWSSEDEFPNIALYHCLRDLDIERVQVFEERKDVFKGIKTFPTKYKGWGSEEVNGKREQRRLRPLSYSHLITK